MGGMLRNQGIDLLRGVSILLVILLHFNIHFKLSNTFIAELLPKKLFGALFWSGNQGVVIFFTLSGYLITYTILKRYKALDKINLKQFYWFRLSRILPPLIALLSVLVVLDVFQVHGFTINKEQTSLIRALFAALTFHVNWLEISVGYLPANWDVLWTISIEETYYILFPLFCLLFKRKWILISLLILVLLISPFCRVYLFSDTELGMKSSFNYIDSIAIGCAVAVLVHYYDFSKRKLAIMGISGVILVVINIFFRFLLRDLGLTDLGLNITLLSLGVAMTIVWMHYNTLGNSKKLQIFRPLTDMGMYSYEIYLTHMFVIISLSLLYKQMELPQSYIPFMFLVSIALSCGLGKVVFTYFSEPINQKLRMYWQSKLS